MIFFFMSAHYMARIVQWVNEKLLFNITCKFEASIAWPRMLEI